MRQDLSAACLACGRHDVPPQAATELSVEVSGVIPLGVVGVGGMKTSRKQAKGPS